MTPFASGCGAVEAIFGRLARSPAEGVVRDCCRAWSVDPRRVSVVGAIGELSCGMLFGKNGFGYVERIVRGGGGRGC